MYSSGVGVRFPSPVGYRGGAPLIGGAVGGATAGAPASVGNVGASSAAQKLTAWLAGEVCEQERQPDRVREDLPWTRSVRHEMQDLYLRSLEAYTATALSLGATELATAERAGRELTTAAPFGNPDFDCSCRR